MIFSVLSLVKFVAEVRTPGDGGRRKRFNRVKVSVGAPRISSFRRGSTGPPSRGERQDICILKTVFKTKPTERSCTAKKKHELTRRDAVSVLRVQGKDSQPWATQPESPEERIVYSIPTSQGEISNVGMEILKDDVASIAKVVPRVTTDANLGQPWKTQLGPRKIYDAQPNENGNIRSHMVGDPPGTIQVRIVSFSSAAFLPEYLSGLVREKFVDEQTSIQGSAIRAP
ncbi:hypothetical protein BDV95DRAFT_591328 [Massariosphaeria phaeospora]|uniref:Uncharacterized protein n=1 Tax=Massariosphaeria phaeospora TaxID=100035 RepID=A0A7C8IEJ0_9PLEO|nr:hypothetical protein BDV95DRAFT_591328 [Massariosphaeria phaeospora]